MRRYVSNTVYARYKMEMEEYMIHAKNEYLHKKVKLRKMENEICKRPSRYKVGKNSKVVYLPGMENLAA